jgi:hypothetical protein
VNRWDDRSTAEPLRRIPVTIENPVINSPHDEQSRHFWFSGVGDVYFPSASSWQTSRPWNFEIRPTSRSVSPPLMTSHVGSAMPPMTPGGSVSTGGSCP